MADAIDETRRVVVSASAHPLANSGQDLGPVSDDVLLEHILFSLSRSPEQSRAVERFIEELHDPNASNFHAWLTAEQFGERFGPAREDIERVVAWLQGYGFTINTVHASGMLVDITGTAGQVKNAFRTEIHRYDLNGAVETANATPLELPAAIASVANGPASLASVRPRRASAKAAKPKLTQTYTNGVVVHYLAPADLATIYNIWPLWNAGINGTGQVVAIVGDSNFKVSDWTTFRNAFGLGQYGGSLTIAHPNCGDPGITTNDHVREFAMDVDLVAAVAPGAAIVLATCKNTPTTDAIVAAVAGLVNQHVPPNIISLSFETVRRFEFEQLPGIRRYRVAAGSRRRHIGDRRFGRRGGCDVRSEHAAGRSWDRRQRVRLDALQRSGRRH